MHRTSTPKRLRFSFLVAIVIGACSGACATRTVFDGETVVPLQPPAPPEPPPPPAAPEPPKRVEVQEGKIQINEKIQFEVNKATIRPESQGLLDEIAQVIVKNPALKKIQVQGHSSAEGNAKANLKLSDARAKAVVAALEKRSVPKGVLAPKGFGSTVPIDSGDTEEAREKNRRVEFVILDPASTKTEEGGAKK